MDKQGYFDYDMDIEQILVDNGMIEDLFYLKDLQQRKLFMNTNVEQSTIMDVVHKIMQFNREDKNNNVPVEERVPILFYLTSNGGEVDAGFELIDVIQHSKTPVYTINLGYQYSMGFLIGLAGHKRFASPNAKFLMHDGSQLVWDSGMKAQDRMAFQKRIEDRTKEYVLSRTSITSKKYDSKLREEWYMFADEAKELGVIDCIIGVDCDMDEVV